MSQSVHEIHESDAFENEIACSMDALDHIDQRHGQAAPLSQDRENQHGDNNDSSDDSLPLVQYNQDHVSCEDLQGFGKSKRKSRGGSELSDEVTTIKSHCSPVGLSDGNTDPVQVRIMQKVLGKSEGCLSALGMTDWNVHHAIKLVKLRSLVNVKDGDTGNNELGLTDVDLKVALQMRDWDVTKAAGDLMRKAKQ